MRTGLSAVVCCFGLALAATRGPLRDLPSFPGGTVAAAEPQPAPPAGVPPVYRFDARADQLLREIFPDKVRISGVTNDYVWRGKKWQFQDLDAIFEHHSKAMHQVNAGPRWWNVGDDSIESAWLGVERDEGWQQPLLRRAARVAELAAGLRQPARPFSSPLEKALFQRDVLQMCMIFHAATGAEDEPQARRIGEHALRELACLWRRLRLTDREYDGLVALRPRRFAPGRFTADSNLNLADDYLPARVLTDEPGWYAMPFADRPSQHFKDYGGRSFIRIYLKPKGWTQPQFYRYWVDVAGKFGANVTRDGTVPALPAGTETLLVRTFGVFLQDGLYVDSGFPEEVLMRLFKYGDTQFDMATSDYRGTLHYRYQLRRRDLLANVPSLGLRRVGDDEPQFFGFLSDVPDHRRAYSATLTTMRNNCISCHSEVFYGASTVYSLARKRLGKDGQERVEGGLLLPASQAGRFHLLSPEFSAFQQYLRENAAVLRWHGSNAGNTP